MKALPKSTKAPPAPKAAVKIPRAKKRAAIAAMRAGC